MYIGCSVCAVGALLAVDVLMFTAVEYDLPEKRATKQWQDFSPSY